MRDNTHRALRLIHEAIALHRPSRVFALFSGGSDSLCSTQVASLHPRFSGCLFVNTGTALPGVLEHVVATCEARGWPLFVRQPPEPYEQMIREAGMPGPGQHGTAYVRLKERTFDAFVRENCVKCASNARHREHDRIMWVTGSRSAESKRRMRNATAPVERDGSQVWVNAIHDWSEADTAAYREREGLERSDVATLIHRSGECNCGTYAQPGERAMLSALFPAFAERVADWENLAMSHGHHYAAVWGQEPLKVHPDQLQLIPRGRARACTDCEGRAA